MIRENNNYIKASYSQTGGYGKNIDKLVSRVINELNLNRSNHNLTGVPDGSFVGNKILYENKKEGILLEVNKSFGPTNKRNHFSVDLIVSTSKNV